MDIQKKRGKVILTFDSKDPLLKELARKLKEKGRNKECDQILAAAEDPPEIDPGG